ncbi:NAD-dependent epimerase/dehydratase family protein [Rhizocola hellebori]|nr:NAD(P)-dependent oxidoreductase [Rhizocola hellebori]
MSTLVKVLLTGAFGNVGSHVLAELTRRGHQVRCFDLPTPANRRFARRKGVGAQVVWGDVGDAEAVARAVAGVDVVIHLAAIIPPLADEQPELARRVNVDGTANVIAACRAQANPPRLLFTSTLDVHGVTLDKPPPRRVDDPMVATNPYTAHKIECEGLVRESGLRWAIFRFADIPVLGLRKAHPIMFEIGLDNRIEALHADDAAYAVASALDTPQVWGRVMFVGGGASCQLTYGDYLTRLMAAMGLRMLPREAFSDQHYCTDWLDTSQSQELLGYQRHDFDAIVNAIAATLGWRRHLMPIAGPLARASMLRLSPYWTQSRTAT